MHLEQFRSLFPVTKNYIFFDHAAVGPISLPASQIVKEFLADYLENGSVNSSRWEAKAEEARRSFARLINAEPEEVAFVKNTSEGLSHVANGIDFRPGDNVVVPAIEFPANIYPWLNLKRYGVEVRFVSAEEGRIPMAAVERAMDERTRLLSISSVQFANGFRADLEELGRLCLDRGIYFCVDAIQSLGVHPMDVKRFNIDFLAADGHKWLLSPEGAGGFFCSKRRWASLHPAKVGWKSVVGAADYSRLDFTLRADAQKFEEGSLNLMTIAALGASLKLLLGIGIEAIEEQVLSLTDHLIEGLKSNGYKVLSPLSLSERSGIVSFLGKEKPQSIARRLGEGRVIVSVRGEAIRVSPHFYNSQEEVEKFLAILGKG